MTKVAELWENSMEKSNANDIYYNYENELGEKDKYYNIVELPVCITRELDRQQELRHLVKTLGHGLFLKWCVASNLISIDEYKQIRLHSDNFDIHFDIL
tara:strand:- start:647 stop:943 length:297 start_codon:yes stop_codon:yes gene_type:complete